MGSKIGSTRLYMSGRKTVFVASGSSCPRINIGKTTVNFRDDYSKGFRISKQLAKRTIC